MPTPTRALSQRALAFVTNQKPHTWLRRAAVPTLRLWRKHGVHTIRDQATNTQGTRDAKARHKAMQLLQLHGNDDLQDFLASLILSECAYKKLEVAPQPLARKVDRFLGLFPEGWVKLDSVQITRDDVAHHYIVALGPGSMYVAFMGTKQARDVQADLQAGHEPIWMESLALAADEQAKPSAHRGFLRRARSVDIEQLYHQAQSQGRRMVLCGHSLGGAVAKLCTLHLLRQLPSQPSPDELRCICFATPAVGNTALARLVESKGWAQYFSTYFLPEDQLMRVLSLFHPRTQPSRPELPIRTPGTLSPVTLESVLDKSLQSMDGAQQDALQPQIQPQGALAEPQVSGEGVPAGMPWSRWRRPQQEALVKQATVDTVTTIWPTAPSGESAARTTASPFLQAVAAAEDNVVSPTRSGDAASASSSPSRAPSLPQLQRLLHLAPQMPRLPRFHHFGRHLYISLHGAHPFSVPHGPRGLGNGIAQHPVAVAATANNQPATQQAQPVPVAAVAAPAVPTTATTAAAVAAAADAASVPFGSRWTGRGGMVNTPAVDTIINPPRSSWGPNVSLPSNPFAYHRMVAYRNRVLHLVHIAANQHQLLPNHQPTPLTVQQPPLEIVPDAAVPALGPISRATPDVQGTDSVQAGSIQGPSAAVQGSPEPVQGVQLRTDIVPSMRVMQAVARPPLALLGGAHGGSQQLVVQVVGLRLQHCRNVQAVWCETGGRTFILKCQVINTPSHVSHASNIMDATTATAAASRLSNAGSTSTHGLDSAGTGDMTPTSVSSADDSKGVSRIRRSTAGGKWRQHLHEAAFQVTQAVGQAVAMRFRPTPPPPQPLQYPTPKPPDLSRLTLSITVPPFVLQQLLDTATAPACNISTPATQKQPTSPSTSTDHATESVIAMTPAHLRLDFASDFHLASVNVNLKPWRVGVVAASTETTEAVLAALALGAPPQPALSRRLAILDPMIKARPWNLWKRITEQQTQKQQQQHGQEDKGAPASRSPATADGVGLPVAMVTASQQAWPQSNAAQQLFDAAAGGAGVVYASGVATAKVRIHNQWHRRSSAAAPAALRAGGHTAQKAVGTGLQGPGQVLAASLAAAAAAAATAAPSVAGIPMPPPPQLPLPGLTAALSLTAAAGRAMAARTPPMVTAAAAMVGQPQQGGKQGGREHPLDSQSSDRGSADDTSIPVSSTAAWFPVLPAPSLSDNDLQPSQHNKSVQVAASTAAAQLFNSGAPVEHTVGIIPSHTPNTTAFSTGTTPAGPMVGSTAMPASVSDNAGYTTAVTEGSDTAIPITSQQQAVGLVGRSWSWSLPRSWWAQAGGEEPETEVTQDHASDKAKATLDRVSAPPVMVAAAATAPVSAPTAVTKGRVIPLGGLIMEHVNVNEWQDKCHKHHDSRPSHHTRFSSLLWPLEQLLPRNWHDHSQHPSRPGSTPTHSSIPPTPAPCLPWDAILVVSATTDDPQAICNGYCKDVVQQALDAGLPVLPLLLTPPPAASAAAASSGQGHVAGKGAGTALASLSGSAMLLSRGARRRILGEGSTPHAPQQLHLPSSFHAHVVQLAHACHTHVGRVMALQAAAATSASSIRNSFQLSETTPRLPPASSAGIAAATAGAEQAAAVAVALVTSRGLLGALSEALRAKGKARSAVQSGVGHSHEAALGQEAVEQAGEGAGMPIRAGASKHLRSRL